MTCEECGGELPEPYSDLGRPRLFCSDACRQRAYRSRGGVASGTTGAERRRREQEQEQEQERRRASGRGALRLAVVAAAADRLQDVMQVTGQRAGGGDDMRSGLDLLGAVAAGCGDQRGHAPRCTAARLDALAGHVTEFAKILTGLHGDRLDDWITTADASDQPDLHSFTRGLRRDHQAVLNGLTMHWNSGVVEGNVNRLKMLKRQMYGRATFPLLRKRVLLTT